MARLGTAKTIDAEITLLTAIGSYAVDRWRDELQSEAANEDPADQQVANRLNVISDRHLHDVELQAAGRLGAFVQASATVVSVAAVRDVLGPSSWEETWSPKWWWVEVVKALFGLVVIVAAGAILQFATPSITRAAREEFDRLMGDGSEQTLPPGALKPSGGKGQH